MSVFIGIYEKKKGYKVYEARNYQKEAYNTFMSISNKNVEKIDFKYPYNVIFSIVKFSTDEKYHPNFCILKNENNEKHILSNNKRELQGYLGLMERLIDNFYGGYKKKYTLRKPVTKKQSIIRKSVTKNLL